MTITDFNVAVLGRDSHLSKWIVEQRRLNVQDEYCRLFEKYIPKIGVVVDVGACLGDHTLSYAQMVGPAGRVHAFEPNHEAFQCLEYNMRGLHQVRLNEMALGAGFDFGTMRRSATQPDNVGATEFEVTDNGTVPMGTLDGFYFPRLDFLKIDVEGMEMEVLNGARVTIGHRRPVMLIELNRPVLIRRGVDPASLLSTITSLGYTVMPSEPHHSLDMEQLDVLALPISEP